MVLEAYNSLLLIKMFVIIMYLSWFDQSNYYTTHNFRQEDKPASFKLYFFYSTFQNLCRLVDSQHWVDWSGVMGGVGSCSKVNLMRDDIC